MVQLCAVLLFYYCYYAKIIVEAIAEIIVKTIVKTIVIPVAEKLLIAIVTNVMIPGVKKTRIADVLYVKNVLVKKNLQLWSERISGHLIKLRCQGKIAGNRIKTIQKSILL